MTTSEPKSSPNGWPRRAGRRGILTSPDRSVALLTLAVAVAACGRLQSADSPDAQNVQDARNDAQNAPDSQGAQDAQDATDATMTTDPLCAVSTTRQPPFLVTFRLQTDGASPVYVHQGCIGVTFDVSACASGYAERLGPDYHCACVCEDATCVGPVVCGACYPDAGEAVMPGAPLEVRWDAIRTTDDTKAGFACVHSRALPAGKYRVSVRVFDDPEAARTSAGGRTVTQDFDLPAPSDTVAVALGGP